MSDTNSDSRVISSSPLYSVSDISVLTKPDVKICWKLYRDTEEQCYFEVPELPPIPDGWKPPSQPCARLCFTTICWFSVGKSDLENFWQEMRGESWKEYSNRLHDSNRPYFSAMTFLLGIVFALQPKEKMIINQPGFTSIVDYRYYRMCFFMSLLCSVLGLSCDALLWLFNVTIELRALIEKEGQTRFQVSRHEVLVHVVLYRIAIFAPMCSLLYLYGTLVCDSITVWA